MMTTRSRMMILGTVSALTLLSVASTSQATVDRTLELGTLHNRAAWKVDTVKSDDLPYCAMVGKFDRGVVLAFAHNMDGYGSVAIDFGQKLFEPGAEYEATLTPSGAKKRRLIGRASSAQSVVVQVGRDSGFFGTLSRNASLGVDLPGIQASFALNNAAGSYQKMMDCAQALADAPPSPPAVRVAEVEGDALAAPKAAVAAPVAGLDSRMRQMEQELAARQREAVALEAERTRRAESRVQELSGIVDDLKDRLASAEDARTSLDKKATAAASRLAEVEKEKAGIEIQLAEKTAALAAAPAKAVKDVAQAAGLKDAHAAEMARLEKQLEEADARYAEAVKASSAADVAQARLHEAKEKIATLEQTRDSLAAQLEQALAFNNTVTSTPPAAQDDARVAEAEAQLAAVKADKARLEAELAAAQKSLTQSQAHDEAMVSAQTELARLRDERVEVQARLDAVEKQNKLMQMALAGKEQAAASAPLPAQIADATAGLRAEITTLKEQHAALQAEYDALKSAPAAEIAEVAAAPVAPVAAEDTQAQAEVARLKTELARAQELLNTQQAEAEAARESHAQQVAALESQAQALSRQLEQIAAFDGIVAEAPVAPAVAASVVQEGGRKLLASSSGNVETPFAPVTEMQAGNPAERTSRVSAIRLAIEGSQQRLDTAQADKDKAADRLARAYEEKDADLQAQAAAAALGRDAVREKIALAEDDADRRALKAKLVAHQAEIATLEQTRVEETRKLTDSLAATQAEYETRIAGLTAERDALKTELSALRAENTALKAAAATAGDTALRAELARNKDEIARLQNELQNLRAGHAAETAQLSSAQPRAERVPVATLADAVPSAPLAGEAAFLERIRAAQGVTTTTSGAIPHKKPEQAASAAAQNSVAQNIAQDIAMPAVPVAEVSVAAPAQTAQTSQALSAAQAADLAEALAPLPADIDVSLQSVEPAGGEPAAAGDVLAKDTDVKDTGILGFVRKLVPFGRDDAQGKVTAAAFAPPAPTPAPAAVQPANAPQLRGQAEAPAFSSSAPAPVTTVSEMAALAPVAAPPAPVAQAAPVVAAPAAFSGNRAAAFLEQVMTHHRDGGKHAVEVTATQQATPHAAAIQERQMIATTTPPQPAAPVVAQTGLTQQETAALPTPVAAIADIAPAAGDAAQALPAAAAAALAPATASGAPALETLLQRAGVQATPAAAQREGDSMIRQWSAGHLAGMQEVMPAQGDMTAQVNDYIARYREDCPAGLSAETGAVRRGAGVDVISADIACTTGGNSYATSFVFVRDAATFTAILHTALPQYALEAQNAARRVADAAVGGVTANAENAVRDVQPQRLLNLGPAGGNAAPQALVTSGSGGVDMSRFETVVVQ